MNIYVGPGSAYARNEKAWVKGYGVTEETIGGLIALILRDLARGYSYGEDGRIIKFTPIHAAQRLNYLIALAVKHGGRGVREAVEYAKRYLKTPPWLRVNLAGPNAPRILRELVERDIVTPEQAGIAVAASTVSKKKVKVAV